MSFGKSAGGRFSDKNGAAAVPQAVETREARLRPFTSSINGGVPEWPKGADCKSVASRFDGSNPSSSTTPAVSNSRSAGFSLFTAVCPRWRHRSNHLPFPQKCLDAVRVRTLFFYPAMALATGAASKLSTPSTPAVGNWRSAVFLFMSVWAALAQAGRQGGKLFASNFLQNQRRALFFLPIQP